MYKEIRALLASSSEEDRKLGQELLTKLYNGDFGPLMNIDRHLIRQARSGMWMINRVYDLKKRHDQTSNSLVKKQYAMEIERITMGLDLESTGRMGTDEEFDFWHGAVNDMLEGEGWQVAGDDPVGAINIAGRLARGGDGLNPRLMDEIRGLTAEFDRDNYRYGYYNGRFGPGTDGLARSVNFRRTQLPGPERAGSSWCEVCKAIILI